jgi:hypothetical protein
MSLPIHVDAYSGYKANERPQAFWLDVQIDNFTGIYEIEVVEDRWYDPTVEYFKVRTERANATSCVTTSDGSVDLTEWLRWSRTLAGHDIELMTVRG